MPDAADEILSSLHESEFFHERCRVRNAFFSDGVHETVDRHELAFKLFEFSFRRFEEGVLEFRGDIDLGDAAFDDFLHVFHRCAAAAGAVLKPSGGNCAVLP